MKTNHKLLKRTVVAMAIVCLMTMAFIILTSGPDLVSGHVKNLQLTQDKFSIHATWDEMECENYRVTVQSNNVSLKYENVAENYFDIEDAVFDQPYKISVQAVFDNGHESRAVSETITPTKLSQEIATDFDRIDGFKGDSFALNAEAKGNIFYSSSNEEVASVDDNGNVTLKAKGKAEIELRIGGDAIYDDAVKTIEVASYPDSLGTTEITAENVSSTRAVISWKKVDFATAYKLLKYNIAKGEFEEIDKFDGDAESAEITRNTGDYMLVAVAEIGDKSVSGEASNAVSIHGAADDAKKYSSSRNIKTLNSSNLKLIGVIKGVKGTTVPQSMCFNGRNCIISYVNHAGSAGRLVEYNSKGKIVRYDSVSGMGHANGSTYNPNTGKIYTVKTHKSFKSATCTTFNESDFSSAGSFTLPKVSSGIAYDESNNKYYLSKGNEIYVLDSSFKKEKFIWKKIRYNHAQDIGAYNGVVYVCTWVSGNNSFIDTYRASDGAYLGSYKTPIGEIESVAFNDGYMYVLVNTIGNHDDKLYVTKERVDFN